MTNQKKALWASFSFMVLFALFAYAVESRITAAGDLAVTEFFADLRQPAATLFMIGITHVGSGLFESIVWLLLTFWLLLKKQRMTALLLTINLAGAWLLNDWLKLAFARPRPDELFREVEANSFSFPSGHAMVSAAFYGMLAYLLAGYRPRWHTMIWSVGGLLIILIGFSRVYLGVHYMSDILAGFAAGSAWLAMCVLARQHLRMRQAVRKTETA